MGRKKGKKLDSGDATSQEPKPGQQGAGGEVQQPHTQQQKAWHRGPPSTGQVQQAQGQTQQQRTGPKAQSPEQVQQPQGHTQQQGAWHRGPPPGQVQQPQGHTQQQGAWHRGPPPGQVQQPQGQTQQQRTGPKAQSPGQVQQPQGHTQQQGAWHRGPHPGQVQQAQGQTQQQRTGPKAQSPEQVQQQQGHTQQQGAWHRGPPSTGQVQQAQGQTQQQRTGPKAQSPGQVQQPQGHTQQQGAWHRGPPPGQVQQAQGQTQQQRTGPKAQSPEQVQKQKRQPPQKSDTERKPKSQELVRSYEFAERITAAKKSGSPIKVATNFFALFISDPNVVVHHYDVEMTPDKPKFLLRKVWNKYVSLVFPGRLTAFDGKNAYSKGPLTEGETSVTTVTVFNEESKKEKEFQVSLKEVRTISFSCFDNYRAKMLKDRSLKILPEAEMSVLDIIMRNWACDNFVRSNNTFFPVSSKNPLSQDLSEKLSVRTGYFQSAFLGYKPYLNFDVSHKAFYKPCHMMNVIGCFEHRQSGDLDLDGLNHFIKGVKVEYQLPNDPSSAKIFRVNKLVNNANSQTFSRENGPNITVAEYFASEKKCKLKYPNLPLLWVGPTQKSIYLPMEFCKIVPDQLYKGLMDSLETRQMVRTATSDGKVRQKAVYDLFDQTNINSHPLMKEFGLSVANDMEIVPARVLDAPSLKTSRHIRVNNGVWRIQDFLEPATLKKWCILNLDKRLRKEDLNKFQNLIKEKGNSFKMRIGDPARSPLEGEPSLAGLKKIFSQLKDMDVVFVIISEAKGLYSKVKSICETQESILTQCVKSRTVSQDMRKLPTTVENILLKVNAKMGGTNFSLDRDSIPQCLRGNVMVVGADVTHPSPGMKMPSVAAVTVSCDVSAFQYGMTARVQPKGEMIRDLEEIIGIHLKKFYNLRRSYPEKIIFFRDGVSEGEMEKVLKGELTAVKRACQPYCQPKITFVTVQKRHHTRFYPLSEAEASKNYNVPVGTCVDSDVVHPRELDFYLVSHASILGTARPTRYRLLHDDNKLTDDDVEVLAFYLCHLFARCNRSVSYPSPTYNAHLAAARVRAYLEGLNLGGDLDVAKIQEKITDRISNISPMFFV